MKIVLLSKKHIILITIISVILIVTIISFCQANSLSSSINFMNKLCSYNNTNKKIAYLTFDDGPNPYVTPKVLDILKEENIKATFFVIGESVDAHPEIIKRAYEEGHYIANHTYNHNNSILYKNSASFKNEIQKTDLAIGNAIGINNYCSHLFRFPNGFMSSNYKSKKKEDITLLSELDYFYLDWNCVNNDSIKIGNLSNIIYSK